MAFCSARPDLASAAATFLISGRGYGHGVGLSQYGAEGYARHGWDYRQILRHYYPGTSLAHVSAASVRVLVRDAQANVVVSAQSIVRVVDGSGGTLMLPAGRYALGSDLVLTVNRSRYRLQPPIRFDPLGSPLAVDDVSYRGSLVVGPDSGGVYVVNELPLDDYVRGVVSWEMPSSWRQQALRAQAVAARSYALAERKPDRLFDLYPDTRSQMYGGVRAETPATDAAVSATAGEVLTWHRQVAFTFFSSTSGGCTAALGDGMPGARSLPYLRSVPDPYDRISPEHAWGPIAVSADRLSALLGLPAIESISVHRNGSGRAAQVMFETAGGERSLSGQSFASALGLRSTWFGVSVAGQGPVRLGGCSAHGDAVPLPPPAPSAAKAARPTTLAQATPTLAQSRPSVPLAAAQALAVSAHGRRPARLELAVVILTMLAAMLSTFVIGSALAWDLRALALLALAASVTGVALKDWLTTGAERSVATPTRRATMTSATPSGTATPATPVPNAPPNRPREVPSASAVHGSPLPELKVAQAKVRPPTHPLQPLAPTEASASGGAVASATGHAATSSNRPKRRPPQVGPAGGAHGKGGPAVTLPPPPGPLVISDVHVDAGPGSRTLTVSWRTSLPASTVGASGFDAPTLWTTADADTTNHQTVFTGLAASTDYRLLLEAVDAWGREQTNEFDITTSAFAGPPNLQANGNAFWLDSQPFFPIALWSPCSDVLNTTLAEGVNLFIGDGCGPADPLRTQLGGRGLSVVDPSTNSADASNVVGWYYPDEWDARLPADPSPVLLDAVARGPATQLSFLTLTSHFYSQAAPLPQGRGMYPLLAAAAGVLGFDLYPLQSWCRTDAFAAVYGAQRELVQLAAGKPTYQWIETAPMEHCPRTELAPTAQTVRAETWLAIAGGASAVGYFPNYWTDQIGNEISQTDNEIKELTPALLAAQTSVTADDEAIKLSAHELNGALYVIAVNSSRNPITTTIQLPGLQGRPLQVYDENRQLAAAGDSFTDAFDAMQVHIYIVAPQLATSTAEQAPPATDGTASSPIDGGCACGPQFR